MAWQEFFYFNKSDRKVLLFLLVLCLSIFMLMSLFDNGDELGHSEGLAPDSLVATADSAFKYKASGSEGGYGQYQQMKAERFPFDPNTADSTQLLRLGLRPWQVRNIYKYRAAGGIYRTPSDFARLYGLTQKQYKELEPYIRISDDYRPAADFVPSQIQQSRDTLKYPRKITPEQRIAINTADTNMLKRIPGIGSYYARKIVNYRKRLGGFVDLAQLKEIEGFPEDALQYMCIPDGGITKLKINQLTLNQLKAHPYINFYQARTILDYRRLKGPLKSLYDLKLHPDFPPEAIERLLPYVEY